MPKDMRKLVEDAVRKIAEDHCDTYYDAGGAYRHHWPLSFTPDETEGFLRNVSDEILFKEYTSALVRTSS